jgi:hypothetical protein
MLPINIGEEVTDLPTMSRQECTEERNGIIVGDIGDGAIHRDDYICESNGQRPIGTIVPLEGEPIAIEGEVCCGPPTVEDGNGGGAADPNTSLPQQDLPNLSGTPATPPNGQSPSIAYLDVDLSPAECEEQGGIVVGDIGNGAIFEDSYVCESNGEPPFAQVVRSEPPFAIEGEVCCGGPTAPTKEDKLSTGSKAGIAVGSLVAFVLVIALLYVVKSNETVPVPVKPSTAEFKDSVSTSSDEPAPTEENV